jgi:hypothetical protein
MAKVTANPDFLDSVRLGAEAGIEASVDVYMPAIAFKLSPASGQRAGRAYEIPVGSHQHESTSAVGEHEQTQDLFGKVVGRIHVASAIGEPPALLTGTLRESAGVNRDDGGFDVVAHIGPNAVNPDDGTFYGQELAHSPYNRTAWGDGLHGEGGVGVLGEEWEPLIFPVFIEGFTGSAA